MEPDAENPAVLAAQRTEEEHLENQYGRLNVNDDGSAHLVGKIIIFKM